MIIFDFEDRTEVISRLTSRSVYGFLVSFLNAVFKRKEMQEEIWKDITDYEGLYQVSSLGRIKSLQRDKEIFLKEWICSGYMAVQLYKHNISKSIKVHKLVAMEFLNHKPDGTQKLVVDHINDNKLDNRLENLQIVTHRFNAYKTKSEINTSKYKGVSWVTRNEKWRSQIRVNGKVIQLGLFNNEYEAHLAYKKALEEIAPSNSPNVTGTITITESKTVKL
jgi:hypothetical protein